MGHGVRRVKAVLHVALLLQALVLMPSALQAMAPTAIRVIDSFADLSDVLTGAISLTGTLTRIPPASPTSAQEVILGSRPPAANGVSAGFNMLQASLANSGGGDESNRRNEQWHWGYNASAITPSHDKSGEPKLQWSIESFYNPVAGSKNLETYLTYVNKANTFNMRPFSFNAILTTDVTDLALSASIVHFLDNNGVEVTSWASGNVRMIGAQFTRENNNAAFARQLNAAANGYIEIVRVENNDRISFGNGYAAVSGKDADIATTETSLLVRRNVAGSFSLQRVSMGAVDSCGAGFKCLRVPN